RRHTRFDCDWSSDVCSSDLFVTGMVFPVADPHDFTDTFGAPRSGGRSHQGCDIFAARGTELYAVERGVIGKVGVNGLGGNRLWRSEERRVGKEESCVGSADA